jgi:hypothetical protein
MRFLGIGKPKRYVTEAAFQRNLQRQLSRTPQTLAALREHGVPNAATFRLEYFFYSASSANAEGLAGALRQKNYSVVAQPSAHDEKLFVVTGWSTPVALTEESLQSWTAAMGRLGFEHDCEFDGWGASVDGSGGGA